MLRRQARLIAVIVTAGLLSTLLVLLLVTPRYTATASILLDTRAPKVFNADTVLPGLNSDLYIVESELEILRSARIANRVLASRPAEPEPEPEPQAERRPWWLLGGTQKPTETRVAVAQQLSPTSTQVVGSSQKIPSAVSAATIEKLLKSLNVERKGRSYIVDVSYTDVRAERAAEIANAFVDAYVADQVDAKFHATRAANLWLKERASELGRELDDVERRQQKFRSEMEFVDVGDITLLQKELSDSALQLVNAKAAAAEAEARLRQVRRLESEPQQLLSIDKAMQSAVISDFRRQQAELQRRIGEYVSRYGETHTNVVNVKAELANLNKEIEKESKRIIESMSLAYDAALEKVKLLESGLQALKLKANRLGESQIKLGELSREITVSSDLYSTLLRRYKETRAQEKLQTADACIVSYAQAPLRPSYPKTTVVMLLASLLWLGLGVSVGLAREIAQPSLRSPGDVEQALGVECAAILPTVNADLDGVQDEGRCNLVGPICRRLDENSGGTFNQGIFNLSKWIGTPASGTSRVVLVVSAQPAEGCSTVAVQLAQYVARTGARTVLVDADLRQAGISATLGVTSPRTFADVVSGDCDAEAAIVQLAGQAIHFCPATEVQSCRPLDILGSREMGSFLDHLRRNFELIVIDTPPLATSVDAEALAMHADYAIVVIKAGRTHRRDVKNVVTRLATEAPLNIGVVLNMTDPG